MVVRGGHAVGTGGLWIHKGALHRNQSIQRRSADRGHRRTCRRSGISNRQVDKLDAAVKPQKAMTGRSQSRFCQKIVRQIETSVLSELSVSSVLKIFYAAETEVGIRRARSRKTFR